MQSSHLLTSLGFNARDSSPETHIQEEESELSLTCESAHCCAATSQVKKLLCKTSHDLTAIAE